MTNALPDQRAEEGGAAADEAEERPESASDGTRAVGGERRDDAEALGGVVQAEPDDEHERPG